MARTRNKDIRSFEQHDFYCLNCGKRNIPIMRPANHLHGLNHRKVLYCCNCKTVVNHMECRNDEEAYNFKLAFEQGEFVEEAKASIEHIERSDIKW